MNSNGLRPINQIHKIAAKTFYNYIFNNDTYFQNYKKLVSGLTDDQKNFIDLTISRALYLYSSQYEILTDFTADELFEQLKVEESLNSKIIYDNTNNCYQFDKYKLPVNFFEAFMFVYKMGFDSIRYPEKVIGKDIIDAGAFCGDSSMVLNDLFKPSRVFCFEPEESCFNYLLRTIELNNLDKEKFLPINQGLGNRREVKEIYTGGAASSIMIAESIDNLLEKTKINITTIDEFVEENNLDIGLIKIDVEGFDYQVLEGAKKTIRKFKPIIMGSIYHNAQQFFEFKPFIESWNLGYKFHFEKMNPNKFLNEISITCEVY
ncbi:MAG: Methyltransferase, FkbM family [uncultured bacterium]|nr:MAG: Methyltransferase, FkbM family [uncultured bacterium]